MKAPQRVVEIVAADGSDGRDVPALTRRQALSLMAASMALASSGCTRPPPGEAHPFVRMPEQGLGGEALYYATSYVRGGYAHGVLVGTREGRPIKVEGNPLHPASLGATDVFAQASVLELWDPDRAKTVLRREAANGPALTSTWSAFDTAWRERAARWREPGAAGLRVLTSSVTSPTLRSQLTMLMERFPGAKVHRHDPLAPDRPQRLIHDFGTARVIVAFGADPFSSGPDSVRNACDWARARAAAQPGEAARLFAVETTPGLFGARADERIGLAPAAVEALLARVAADLGADDDEGADVKAHAAAPLQKSDAVAAFAARLAEALRHAGPAALVVVGDALSPRAHALAAALHRQLGAEGKTVRAIESPSGTRDGTLAGLMNDVRAGRVDALLVLGGNPAYDAPGEFDVAQTLARVPFSARLGLYDDETSRCCHWHLPASHVYEAWGDARAFDGTASLLQPVIRPLYDSRSAHELLAALTDDALRDGRALVRRHWQSQHLGGADFERGWRDSLRRGAIDGSAFETIAVAASAGEPPSSLPAADAHDATDAATSRTLAAVFVPGATVGDGAFANNGWLQELPQVFTQISWGNALLIGPATARALALQSGDVVRASVGERSVEAPVWVQAAHAEGAVTLPLGHGRRAAGRVGDGVGFDAYALRPISGATAMLTLARTGRRIEFARSQETMSQHGRELARSVPASHPETHEERPSASLYPPVAKQAAHAWGMAIDLDACTGCSACTIACQAENNIPVVGAEEVARGRAMHWIRIDHYVEPEAPAQSGIFQPVPCMHCENAPCEIVCPVGATVHDSEGLNVQVYNRCVGTRFCSNNCPYKVRRFNFLQYSDETTETLKAQHNPDVTVRARGVMEKCTYCLQRVTRARLMSEKSGRPLADGDVVTACQSACPTGAIHFGDVNDPASDVSRAKASPRHYTLLGELNTRPRTTYLARVQPDGEAHS